MRSRAPSAPFEPVSIIGESVTVETKGKILVLPTGHPYLLPKYNEFTLTEGRALPEAGTYTFTNDFETELGIKNLITPWIAIYDPAGRDVDFYLFTHRPKNLEFRRDESGNIYELVLYPGNGLIYHGQITYPDLTLDSDSNLIPNFLEESIEGSLTKFLQPYTTVDGTPGSKIVLLSNKKEIKTYNGYTIFVRGVM